jgi:hypothetical protein
VLFDICNSFGMFDWNGLRESFILFSCIRDNAIS